jgi:hypothetical protein
MVTFICRRYSLHSILYTQLFTWCVMALSASCFLLFILVICADLFAVFLISLKISYAAHETWNISSPCQRPRCYYVCGCRFIISINFYIDRSYLCCTLIIITFTFCFFAHSLCQIAQLLWWRGYGLHDWRLGVRSRRGSKFLSSSLISDWNKHPVDTGATFPDDKR